MKKKFLLIIALMLGLSLIIDGGSRLGAGDGDGAKATGKGAVAAGVGEGAAPLKKERPERNAAVASLEPSSREGLPMSAALLLDLAVPGGGHFYTGNYATGFTFLGLKLLGAYALYYTYRDWQYHKSLYYSARRANRRIDPNHELQFEDPDGGYNNVEDFRRDYDRAAQRITFAALANVAVYAVSLLMTYQAVEKINRDARPTFEIQYSCATIDPYEGMAMSIAVTTRF